MINIIINNNVLRVYVVSLQGQRFKRSIHNANCSALNKFN